jgi:hypothetical protein
MARLIVAALLLGACATPYQRQGLRGGFTESQLDENVFRVSFHGNGFTSHDRVADFTLLRSAELAREHGYHFFLIVQASDRTSYSTYTTPIQSTTTANVTSYGGTATTTITGGGTHLIAMPGASNTIVCFTDRPEGYPVVYNADFLYRSLSSRYGIATNEPLPADASEDGTPCGPELPRCPGGTACRTSTTSSAGHCVRIGY